MSEEKILIWTKNWLGDVVFESAAFKAIKENFPDSELVCVAPKRCHAILNNYSYVDRVIPFDEKKQEQSLRSRWHRAKEWQDEEFTHAFVFHRSFTRALMTKLAKIPYRAGFRTKWGRRLVLNHSVTEPANGFHDTDYYLYLLKELGLKVEIGMPYEFHYSNTDEIRMLKFIQKLDVEKNKFIVCHTGANWEPKRWPIERFWELLEMINEREKIPILLTGTKQDANRIRQLTDRAHEKNIKAVSLAGNTSLAELGALFSFARAVVSGDSGPLHIASGVGAKTVALFGPSNEVKTGPRGRGKYILIKKETMAAIEAKEVMDALEKLRAFSNTQ